MGSYVPSTLQERQEMLESIGPVSYTHLDVYKRQGQTLRGGVQLLQRLLRGAAKHLFHKFFLLQSQQACSPAVSGTKKDFSPVSKSCLETI